MSFLDIDDDQAFDELTDSHATSSASTPSKTFIKEAINTKTTKHSVSSKSTPKSTKSVLESMLDILREWITEKTLEHVGLIAKEPPVCLPEVAIGVSDKMLYLLYNTCYFSLINND